MIVDRYPMQPEAAAIIRRYWPANLSGLLFPQAMRNCQAALIRFHYPRMNPATRRVALATLETLEGGNCPLPGDA